MLCEVESLDVVSYLSPASSAVVDLANFSRHPCQLFPPPPFVSSLPETEDKSSFRRQDPSHALDIDPTSRVLLLAQKARIPLHRQQQPETPTRRASLNTTISTASMIQ
jgi:hypothetical protein